MTLCYNLSKVEGLYKYGSELKDQNDVKKKSKCEITFLF